MRMLALVLLAAVLLPAAVAQQTQGTVSTVPAPEHVDVDYSKYVRRDGGPPEGQSFTVRVQGQIDCVPGAGPPQVINATVGPTQAIRGTNAFGEKVTYFALEPTSLILPWRSTGGGTFQADRTFTVDIVLDAASPTDRDLDLVWGGAQFDQPSDNHVPGCNPSGYHWNTDATPITVVIPGVGFGVGNASETEGPGDDNGTPLPVGLAMTAMLVAWVFARRR